MYFTTHFLNFDLAFSLNVLSEADSDFTSITPTIVQSALGINALFINYDKTLDIIYKIMKNK